MTLTVSMCDIGLGLEVVVDAKIAGGTLNALETEVPARFSDVLAVSASFGQVGDREVEAALAAVGFDQNGSYLCVAHGF